MVLTRSASGVDVPPPPPTPSRPRSSAGTPATARKVSARRKSQAPSQSTPSSPPSPSSASPSLVSSPLASSSSSSSSYIHTPSTLTMLWLAVSLPLVIWDCGYVLLRPHSMPGGALHWPVWQPYALYGEVDHVYGFKQWNAGDGFGAAQSVLNVAETALYLGYIYLWARYGKPGKDGKDSKEEGKSVQTVGGRPAARAVLMLFAAAVMTLSKTVLYWLNEYFSGFSNIGHNDAVSLVFLWIIPNGMWIVFPAIITYITGSEIVSTLAGPLEPIEKKRE